MEKNIKNIVLGFDDGQLYPGNVKKQIAQELYESKELRKKYAPNKGLVTGFILPGLKTMKCLEKLDKAFVHQIYRIDKCDQLSMNAFIAYDKIIKGVHRDFLDEFATRHYTELDFPKDLQDYDIYIITGSIKPVVKQILKLNDIQVKEVVASEPILDSNNYIQSLTKNTATSTSKVAEACKLGIDFSETCVVGAGYWECGLIDKCDLAHGLTLILDNSESSKFCNPHGRKNLRIKNLKELALYLEKNK